MKNKTTIVVFIVAFILSWGLALKCLAGPLEDKKVMVELSIQLRQQELRAANAELILLQGELAKVNDEIEKAKPKKEEKK